VVVRELLEMMKKLAGGIALALACLPAGAETGFYAGISGGHVRLKDSVAGIEIEATGTGYKVFGGYRFNEYGSLEAAYLDGGKPDDTVYGVTIESDATAWQASALWQIPISPRFEAYARFSVVVWEAVNSATDGRITLSQKNDGTDGAFGLGAALHVTPRLGLRAEVEAAELDGTDLLSISLGGLVRF
jgi:OOP family OmpA-OmpF porin